MAAGCWHARRAKRPLPVDATTDYTAVYMEAIFDPGTTAAIHSHSGPEAFYTLTGETCLETPDGVLTGRADGPVVIVPGGPPMLLTATVPIRRRGVVLILHDSITTGDDHGPRLDAEGPVQPRAGDDSHWRAPHGKAAVTAWTVAKDEAVQPWLAATGFSCGLEKPQPLRPEFVDYGSAVRLGDER